jgi:hypothetical protein
LVWRLNEIGWLSLAVALLLGWSGSAGALTIQDINPRFFPKGGVNTGFLPLPGDFPDFQSSPNDRFLCAGDGTFIDSGVCAGKTEYDLSIVQNLMIVYQNPQARGEPSPTPADPFIADSVWTVTNNSGEDFDADLLLMFTNVNLTAFDGRLTPGPYPDLLTGLDRDLLRIVMHTAGTADYYYLAALLGPLGIGESVQITVRYVVSEGPMPIVDSDIVMPPLSVLGFVVPEPTTWLLLVLGLAGLVALRGRVGQS